MLVGLETRDNGLQHRAEQWRDRPTQRRNENPAPEELLAHQGRPGDGRQHIVQRAHVPRTIGTRFHHLEPGRLEAAPPACLVMYIIVLPKAIIGGAVPRQPAGAADGLEDAAERR